jgi:hypothetical protein
MSDRGRAVAFLMILTAAPPAAADAGADIVTTVGTPGPVQVVNFGVNHPAVLAGCVQPGTHRIIPFAASADNAGFGDAQAGITPPAPSCGCACGPLVSGSFTWSDRTCSWETTGFTEFMVAIPFGDAIQFARRENSCVNDSQAWRAGSPPGPLFSCQPGRSQGIQRGWRRNLSTACQFILDDDLMDREYRLVVTTNRSLAVPEERVNNNTTAVKFATRSQQLVTPAPTEWIRFSNANTSGVSFLPSAVSSDVDSSTMFWMDGGLKFMTIRDGIAQFDGRVDPPSGVSMSLSPVAVSWAPGRIDVFTRGSDNRLWHAWGNEAQMQGWDNPADISDMRSQPSAVAFAPGRLDIFWINSASNLQHTWWGPGWFNEDLGRPPNTPLINNPGAVAQGVNAMNIFVPGGDGRLWHKGWFNGWTTWESVPGVSGINGTPSATSPTPGRADVFWWTSANTIGHVGRVNGGWTALDFFSGGPGGGVVASSPTAISWGPTRVDVFWRTAGNRLTQVTNNNGNWSFGTPPATTDILTSPSAVTWANGDLDVFFGSTGGKLGMLRWF